MISSFTRKVPLLRLLLLLTSACTERCHNEGCLLVIIASAVALTQTLVGTEDYLPSKSVIKERRSTQC